MKAIDLQQSIHIHGVSGTLKRLFHGKERGSRWKRLVDRYLGIPLLYLAAFFRRGERAVSAKEPETIAVLSLGAIGDTLLSSALTGALRRRWPMARITLITSKANARAAVFLPDVDATASFPITDILGTVRFLRKSRFDLLVDAGQWARLGALLCAFSGAGRTVGFRTDGQHRHVAFDATAAHQNDCHEVVNFQRLAGVACGTDATNAISPCLKTISPHLPEYIRDFAQGAPLVVCHMWPAGVCAHLKEWPPEHWATLIDVLTHSGFRVLLSGGKDDAERNNLFMRRLPDALQPYVRSIAGTMSLESEAAMLHKVAALISVNTGYMHLSALLDVPTIDLHGPTNPLRWGGVGQRVVHLLPETPANVPCAYLSLGFEYPHGAENVLHYLKPQQVLIVLREFGSPFSDLPSHPTTNVLLRNPRDISTGVHMHKFDIDEFMNKVRMLAEDRMECSLPELFALKGERFVRAAYWKVLERPADQTGIMGYTSRANDSIGKMRILLALAMSTERGLLRGALRHLLDVFRYSRDKLSMRIPHKNCRNMDDFYFAFEERFRSDFDIVFNQLRLRYSEPIRQAFPSGGTALDLGCGRGEALALLTSLGFQATGVDTNLPAVEFARSRNLHVEHEDIFRYLRKIPDASLTVVTAFHVMEHLSFEYQMNFLDSIHRVLCPGGLLILETPNTRNLLVSGGDFYRDPTHVRQIFPDTLDFMLERTGFSGGTHFFTEDERPMPADTARLDEIQDYFYVSRDMAWIGCKNKE